VVEMLEMLETQANPNLPFFLLFWRFDMGRLYHL